MQGGRAGRRPPSAPAPLGNGCQKGSLATALLHSPERSRAFSRRYPAAVRGVGWVVLFGRSPTKVPCPPPLSCGGGTGASEPPPLSPAAILPPWGAANEFTGCFNRMIIQTMVIEPVIVRRIGVAVGIRVGVMCFREVRSAICGRFSGFGSVGGV